MHEVLYLGLIWKLKFSSDNSLSKYYGTLVNIQFYISHPAVVLLPVFLKYTPGVISSF